MAYYIGIDVSTTATKALLMNAMGKVLGIAIHDYPYQTFSTGLNPNHDDEYQTE